MKPQALRVANIPNRSFSVRYDFIPNVNSHWHYHPEVELIHINRGGGTQFIGDNISRFQAGDIILVGSNLPHYWHYDDVPVVSDDIKTPFATVIHFTETFWGERFLNLPENASIKNVLERAKRGILLREKLGEKMGELIDKLYHAEGTHRLILLLECLLTAYSANEQCLLASIGFRNEVSESENDRINAIYAYTLKNFQDKIMLNEIADVADLTPNAFCRYFKSRTGKQYSQFLLEIRVGYACKLLIDGKKNLKQICDESGFNNPTCFFEKFKLITGNSPVAYQKKFTGK